jgi:hypothetical protein
LDLHLFIYYRGRKQLKTFFTQIESTVPLMLDPPIRMEGERKKVQTHENSMMGGVSANIRSLFTVVSRRPYPRHPHNIPRPSALIRVQATPSYVLSPFASSVLVHPHPSGVQRTTRRLPKFFVGSPPSAWPLSRAL